MSKERDALKLALEVLRSIAHAMPFPVANKTIEAIKEALAQPEQKPVAVTRMEDGYIKIDYLADPFPIGPLYAAPLQPAQQTCNCRWNDETQVQQCTLHAAHVDAIHEWAERAKTAEAKLKAQQQEPVAWKDKTYGNLHHQDFGNSIPLYTTPPHRKPLTNEEMQSVIETALGLPKNYMPLDNSMKLGRAIEQAHGIKE